jgi:hypothetical protein
MPKPASQVTTSHGQLEGPKVTVMMIRLGVRVTSLWHFKASRDFQVVARPVVSRCGPSLGSDNLALRLDGPGFEWHSDRDSAESVNWIFKKKMKI